MSDTPMQQWSPADVEPVVCCICGTPGEPRFDVPPFGVVRCRTCTLVYVSPRLKAEALQRVYDDADYFEGRVYGRSTWSPSAVLQRTWTAGRLSLIATAGTRGGRMLEIGAGEGHFLAAAQRRGFTGTGVELSRTASAYARDTLGLDVRTGQVEEVGLEPPYDVVCAWDTIEHVPDPVRFLRTVRSLLADDGLLAFSTPSVASLPARLLGRRWWTLKPVEHIWHFSPRTHATALARAGLALTGMVTSPVAPSNAGRLDSLTGLARPLP